MSFVQKCTNKIADEVYDAAATGKNLRTNPWFVQDFSIFLSSLIDLMNWVRDGNAYQSLKKILESTYLIDVTGIKDTLNNWVKPYNTSSVNAEKLREGLFEAFKSLGTEHAKQLTGYQKEEENKPATVATRHRTSISVDNEMFYRNEALWLEIVIPNALVAMYNDLNYETKGTLYGYATQGEFLRKAQEYVQKQMNPNWKPEDGLDYKFYEAINTHIPALAINKVSWLEWAMTTTFDWVSIGCAFLYLSAWELVDRAKFVAQIGQTKFLGFVNHLNFDILFLGLISTGFTFKLLEACRKICEAIEDDSSLLKKKALWEVVTSVAELVLYGSALASALNLISRSPAFIALSLLAAKGLACLSKIFKPQLPLFYPHPTVEVSEKANRLTLVMQAIRKTRPYRFVAELISKIAQKVMGVINDCCNFVKDGPEKTLKLASFLKLYDHLHPDAPIFTKCRATLGELQRWLYATKIFVSIANFWKQDMITKQMVFVGPFKIWSEKEKAFVVNMESFGFAFLDVAGMLDTADFIRKYTALKFDLIVDAAERLGNVKIPVLEYALKDIPMAGRIFSKPKDVFIFVASLLHVTHQLCNEMLIKGIVAKSTTPWYKRPEFAIDKLLKLAAGFGKIALLAFTAHSSQLWFLLLDCFTGSSAFASFIIGQIKTRVKMLALPAPESPKAIEAVHA